MIVQIASSVDIERADFLTMFSLTAQRIPQRAALTQRNA